MSDKPYKIVFSGKVKANQEIDTVKNNLVLMLNLTPERVESMFSGKEIVIKRFETLAAAQLRQIKLEKAGIICQIKKHGEEKRREKPRQKEENILEKFADTLKKAVSKNRFRK